MAEIVVAKIHQTRDDSERLRHELTKAMFHNDVMRMNVLMSKASELGYEQRLGAEISSAALLIDRIQRERQSALANLKKLISKADITEIKPMKAPPQLVKDVITATVMLLGFPEKQARDWHFSICLLGKSGLDGFLTMLSNVDVDRIPHEVAVRVKNMISSIDEDICRKVNKAIVGFYLWVQNTVNAVLINASNNKIQIEDS